MARLEIPCGTNCNERHAGCHAACEKWAKYEALKFEEYERRKKIGEQKADLGDYVKATCKRMKRGKRKYE